MVSSTYLHGRINNLQQVMHIRNFDEKQKNPILWRKAPWYLHEINHNSAYWYLFMVVDINWYPYNHI